MSNIREKLAIVFCESVPMEKVNLFFFYLLGAQLSPLSKMTAVPKNRIDVLIDARRVGPRVRNLLDWTVELKVCRAGAKAFLDAVDKVEKWSNTVESSEDWTKQDPSTDLMFQQIIDKAKWNRGLVDAALKIFMINADELDNNKLIERRL